MKNYVKIGETDINSSRDAQLLGNLSRADRIAAAAAGTQDAFVELNMFAPQDAMWPLHLTNDDLVSFNSCTTHNDI